MAPLIMPRIAAGSSVRGPPAISTGTVEYATTRRNDASLPLHAVLTMSAPSSQATRTAVRRSSTSNGPSYGATPGSPPGNGSPTSGSPAARHPSANSPKSRSMPSSGGPTNRVNTAASAPSRSTPAGVDARNGWSSRPASRLRVVTRSIRPARPANEAAAWRAMPRRMMNAVAPASTSSATRAGARSSSGKSPSMPWSSGSTTAVCPEGSNSRRRRRYAPADAARSSGCLGAGRASAMGRSPALRDCPSSMRRTHTDDTED